MTSFIEKIQKYVLVNAKNAKEIIKEDFEGALVFYAVFMAIISLLSFVMISTNTAIIGMSGNVSVTVTVASFVLNVVGMLLLAFVLSLVAGFLGTKTSFKSMFSALVYSNTLALLVAIAVNVVALFLSVIPFIGLVLASLLGIFNTLAMLVAVYFFYTVLTKGFKMSTGSAIVLLFVSFVVYWTWNFMIAMFGILAFAGGLAASFGPKMM